MKKQEWERRSQDLPSVFTISRYCFVHRDSTSLLRGYLVLQKGDFVMNYFLTSLILLCAGSACASQNSSEAIYSMGYEAGYMHGKDDGNAYGQAEGIQAGAAQAVGEPVAQPITQAPTVPDNQDISIPASIRRHKNNYRNGYKKGYQAGWQAGQQEGYAQALQEVFAIHVRIQEDAAQNNQPD